MDLSEDVNVEKWDWLQKAGAVSAARISNYVWTAKWMEWDAVFSVRRSVGVLWRLIAPALRHLFIYYMCMSEALPLSNNGG
jgi:hypothetical protein